MGNQSVNVDRSTGPILLETPENIVIWLVSVQVNWDDGTWSTHTVAGIFLPMSEWGKDEVIKCEYLLTRLLVEMFSREYWDTSDTRDWGWEKRTRCKTTLLIYSSESHQLAYLIYYWVILETSRTFHPRLNSLGCVLLSVHHILIVSFSSVSDVFHMVFRFG